MNAPGPTVVVWPVTGAPPPPQPATNGAIAQADGPAEEKALHRQRVGQDRAPLKRRAAPGGQGLRSDAVHEAAKQLEAGD